MSTIIDITLSSENITERIKDWEVSNEALDSDHKLITYNIEMNNAQEIELYRNIKKTRWDEYRYKLKLNLVIENSRVEWDG